MILVLTYPLLCYLHTVDSRNPVVGTKETWGRKSSAADTKLASPHYALRRKWSSVRQLSARAYNYMHVFLLVEDTLILIPLCESSSLVNCLKSNPGNDIFISTDIYCQSALRYDPSLRTWHLSNLGCRFHKTATSLWPIFPSAL